MRIAIASAPPEDIDVSTCHRKAPQSIIKSPSSEPNDDRPHPLDSIPDIFPLTPMRLMYEEPGNPRDGRLATYLLAVSCFLAPRSTSVGRLVSVVGWFLPTALSSFAVCSLASDISCGSGVQYELGASVVAKGVLPSGSRIANMTSHVGFVSHQMTA